MWILKSRSHGPIATKSQLRDARMNITVCLIGSLQYPRQAFMLVILVAFIRRAMRRSEVQANILTLS